MKWCHQQRDVGFLGVCRAVLYRAWPFLLVCAATAAQAQSVAYITNSGSNKVSVIDTATQTVIATVAVVDGPGGVAVKPDGAFVYVANLTQRHGLGHRHRDQYGDARTVTVGELPLWRGGDAERGLRLCGEPDREHGLGHRHHDEYGGRRGCRSGPSPVASL